MTYSGPVIGFAIIAGLMAVLILAIVASKVSGDIADVRIAKHTGQDRRALNEEDGPDNEPRPQLPRGRGPSSPGPRTVDRIAGRGNPKGGSTD